MKALINAALYDFENYRENQYVLFDKNIEETGDMKDFTGAEEIVDCSGTIVIPGLVNCHTHVYSTLSRGMSVNFNPRSFRDILDQLWWKLDGELDLESVYYSGLVYGIDCIKNGVTTVVDHHASGRDIRGSLDILRRGICDELGLRGIFCFETSDRFNLLHCIEENIEFSRKSSEYSSGVFGLHASLSLSEESMRKVAERLDKLPVHIHVAESRDDVEDCREKYGEKILERLDRHGLLKRNSILAHCVHITEEEAMIIRNRECFIALNTSSNMNNAVGLPDYDLFRRIGIKCLQGNDGLGSNLAREYLNTAFTMKYRLGSPIKFGFEDLIQIIRNGYEYAGRILNINIGKLKKGFKADFITLPYLPPTPMDENNIFGHLFYGVFENFHPRDVWVSGKCLMRRHELTVDERAITERAREEAIRLWERINN